MNLTDTKDAVKNGRIEWLSHSLKRMFERGIARQLVRDAIVLGEVIEDYPDAGPYPSALVLGIVDGVPLHVVVAFDSVSRYCMVITAYHPDLEHFNDDYKTRKRDGQSETE